MSNEQFYIAVAVPSAIAFMGFLTTLAGFLLQNKRLDDVMKRLERVELTMEAIRQDIADMKAADRVHVVEIANLKERLK